MQKRKILLIVLTIFMILGISLFVFNNKNADIDIEEVLKTSAYSYLSSNAKDYIKNYYNQTGEVLLTEKNKVEGKAYLNPDYIEYLDELGVGNTGYIPNELTYDYNNEPKLSNINDLPRKYDSRNVNGNNYVTSTKRQYSELCWDYALTSVIESKLLKEGLENDVSSLDLAERMIDYASSDPISVIDIGKNPYFGNYTFNSLADSGNADRYSSVLINGLFPIDENDWKYEKEYMEKVKPEDIYDFNKVNYQVNEIKYLKDDNYNVGFDENTNKILKQAIIDNGSIAMALRIAVGNNFVSYNAVSEDQLNDNNTKNVLYYKDHDALYQSNDHMASIIGWDDDYIHNVCVLEGGELKDSVYNNGAYTCNNGSLKTINGAWIIKDSSNSSYSYVAFETVNSEYYMVTDVSYRDWDNVYSSSYADGYTKDSYKYVFEKNNNLEKITSIKFYATEAFSNFNVYIDTYDGTGEKILTTINTEVGGMYTIPINSELVLASNKFSIRFGDSAIPLSIFTNNIDSSNQITINDAKVVNSFNYQEILNNYQNVVVLDGVSRNVDNNIDYIIKDSNDVDVTNLFDITRNYAVGNYINTLIKFNNNVSKGKYTGYAYIDNVLLDTFKIDISNYMENISGAGTKDDPYIITNPAQLDMIRLNKYNYYKLGNDIDLTYDTQNENGLFYNEGLGWEPISYSACSIGKNNGVNCSDGFSGIFDGDNHKIIGLYINRPDENIVGLFRNTYNNNFSALNFRNIILKDVNITGKNFVGSLIGYAYGASYERNLIFENISVDGSIRGNDYVGGLIGYFYGGTGLNDYLALDTLCTKRHCLNNLFNSSKVEGNNYVGGIVGLLETQKYYSDNEKWRSTIDAYNWQNNGTIISLDKAAGFVGNIIINNGNKIILNNSINTGIVKSNDDVAIVNDVECNNAGDTYPNCSLILNNTYYTNDIGYKNSSLISANNVKKYGILELTDDSIYNAFIDFNTFYKKETINNIKRIPFVKNAYVEYTDTHDILIDGSKNINLYNYIDGSHNVDYSVEDESIASIDEDGNVTPLKNGATTIHITSYYDGYDGDINLVVDLGVENYTITYNLNGGTSTNPTSYNVETATFTLNNPTKEGYTFVGWTGSNGDVPQTEIIIEKGSIGNRTYTANWTPLMYTVTFDSNGGTSVESKIVQYNNTVLEPENPSRENYVFKYWTLNGSRYDFNAPVTGDIVLVAFWDKIELVLSQILTNNGYIITNNFVSGFNLGDSINSIKNKLNDSDITIETQTNIISTGTVISKNNEHYIVIIKGDITGDGKINSGDLLQMKKYLLEEVSLTDSYKQAGIIESNGEIKSLDLLRMRQYLLGEYTFK